MSLRAIVLAAGRGTRMRSDLPKVLFPVAGRPLLAWVLDAVAAVAPDETLVVVGLRRRAGAGGAPRRGPVGG